MGTLIIYASKHGFTERCAKLLSERLPGSKSVDIGKNPGVVLDGYDTVVLGSSVYVGTINKAVTQFATGNLEALKGKRVGLFVCCGFEDKAMEQMAAGFPKELVDAAEAKGYFGYDFSNLGFLEKMISRAVKAPVGKTDLRTDGIAAFAKSISG